MPTPGADTGSGNFALLFRDIDPTDMVFPTSTKVQIRGDGSVAQSDFIDRIGGWVHTINGSYWKVVPPKESLIEELLRRY